MAVRAFDGNGDYIDFAIPAGLDITTQALTIVAVGKRAVNTAWHTYLTWQTSGNSYRLALDITNADRLGGATQTSGLTQTSGNSSGGSSPFTIQSTDGWTIAIWSKPGSTGPGTFSVFKGGAWTHTASNLGSQGQPGTANPSGKITVGRFEAIDDYYNGRLATIAIWVGTELSQAQKESLAGGSSTAWSSVASGPTEQWEFNQAAWATQVVGLKGLASSTSISGNGTIVTGDDPASGIYTLGGGSADATVTAVAATATGAAPIAVVSGSSPGTVTAVAATGLGSAPAAAVAAGSTVAGVVADATGAAPPANQIISSTVTAPAVVALGSAPIATVGAGGDATVTAVAATGLGSAPVAALSAGQVVTAVVADATGAAPAATLAAGVTVAAVPALATGAAPRPTISPAPVGGAGSALVAVAFAEDAA